MLYKAKNIGFVTIGEQQIDKEKTVNPLKILLVITQGVWGGSQRYVFDMAKELSKKHSVTVAIGEIQGAKDLQNQLASLKDKVNVITLKHLQRSISPLHDTLAIFELQHLYKKIQPDIIHLNSTKAGLLGSLASALQKKLSPRHQTTFPKIIYTVHGWIFLEPLSKFSKKIFTSLEQKTAHLKDAFIVLSDEEKIIGQQMLGIPKEKITTIPLGISHPPIILTKTEARAKIESMMKTEINHSEWIGTIAGLYKTKGLDTLIKSIAKNHTLQRKHYFILGEGPERKYLTNLIKTHHLENTIHLLGHIENAALLLPAFDLFVLPSRKEGLPYALLEAMSYELPIIATKVGGVPSLLHSYEAATCISPQNEDELMQALATYHSLPQPHTSKEFTLQSMITSSEELYDFLLLPQ